MLSCLRYAVYNIDVLIRLETWRSEKAEEPVNTTVPFAGLSDFAGVFAHCLL